MPLKKKIFYSTRSSTKIIKRYDIFMYYEYERIGLAMLPNVCKFSSKLFNELLKRRHWERLASFFCNAVVFNKETASMNWLDFLFRSHDQCSMSLSTSKYSWHIQSDHHVTWILKVIFVFTCKEQNNGRIEYFFILIIERGTTASI